jgi:hypothetical protein
MVSPPNGRKRSVEAWRIAALALAGSVVVLGSQALGADKTYVQQGKDRRIVLVELYTSQGCSSCPPADQLQAELAERPDVLALTFPVDYWDYLGWHDTLAHPANSMRQMDYSKRSQSGRVFTPQMVIDGVFSAVGGERQDVLAKLNNREMVASLVPLSIDVKDEKISVKVPSAPGALNGSDTGKATLWLFPFAKVNVVHISGGENEGHSVRYAHVVGNFVGLGQWSGAGATYEHTLDAADRDEFGYAAVLQEDRVGPVLGVAWAGDESQIQPAPIAPEPGVMADPLVVNIAR